MNMIEFKKILKVMGYNPTNGKNKVWSKYYKEFSYTITITFGKGLSETTVNYGEDIKCCRTTTSNFSQPESVVVLECVNRLIEKGYSPKSIKLEKYWKVGGYLDIYVTDTTGKGYLMIECKQYGKAYNEAKKIILTNNYKKEQLFNYYLNDKNPKYLLLYTSTLSNNNEIIYKNDIICTDILKKCPTQKDLYDTWDKNFITKAIFEDDIKAYHASNGSLLKRDLKEIDYSSLKTKDNEGSIYNLFAEILRRFSVSDKSNAYDKIFNLFLCKIVDEDDCADDEELLFQWKSEDTPESVLNRLNDLYIKGMNKYLKLYVEDVTENEFRQELDKVLLGSKADGRKLQKMFNDLRIYRNNAFAFKEIIDRETFLENAEIVKAIILLLQQYKIRYNHKQKYLSEFFERLLNIGIKQEAGQFFTPIPIADFVCHAIDVEDIIKEKIENKDIDFLPYVIDYACGSGHFLTEMMDRVDKVLQKIDENDLKTRPQKDNLRGWKSSYKWAKEFVYGIEKDYRLAKTTKVATFLNGDGDANIICANGLDSFSSNKYVGKLNSKEHSQDNPVFDIVVANPPYSVSDFKLLLQNANLDFSIAERMTDNSDDIECLFIERTKQLLKCGGRAGIVLPSTILLNASHYLRARCMILEKFKIKGIAEFGKSTFALTGQNTVILFLERRNDNDKEQALQCIDNFLENLEDFTFDNNECMIERFVELRDEYVDKEQYISFLRMANEDELLLEKKKLLYFLLCYNQKVVVSHYGKNTEEEKRFLGYEHSNMSNYEGIHPYPYNDSGIIKTPLFNLDKDESVAKLIQYNFQSKELCLPESLKQNVKIKYLTDMMIFSNEEFGGEIYVKSFINPFVNSDVPLKSIQQYIEDGSIEILDFMRKPVKKSKRKTGKIPYYGANGQTGTIDSFLFDETLLLIGEDGARWGENEQTAMIITGKSWVNNHAHVLRVNNEKIRIEFLKAVVNYYDFSYLKSRPNGGKLLQSDLRRLEIPNMSISQQDMLIRKIKRKNLKDLIVEEFSK